MGVTMAAVKKGAMKAKSMKSTMKAMGAKKVSVIAKGKRARVSVFKGSKQKTSSGMSRADLVKGKSGKIVSKKASARAKKNFAESKWNQRICPRRRQIHSRPGTACEGQVVAVSVQ